jgi:hypothetical protein
LVDIGFPELGEAWENPPCVSALAVVRHAPTAVAVARMPSDRLARLKRPAIGGRVIGPLKAGQPKQLAQTSVAAPELERQVVFEMRLLIAPSRPARPADRQRGSESRIAARRRGVAAAAVDCCPS